MAEPAIRTDGLTKHFGDVVALDRLSLQVEQGEIFGFLGPNGAGKSTTIRLLLNLIHPTAGDAWVMGVPVGDVARAHRHLSYVPGDVALWPQLTGTETLELLGNISGDVDQAFCVELIERLQLDPLMEEEFQRLAREASDRGQTVFLSSHILDEVEDLCHRVAILRDGQLIEVATLDQLRELDTTIYEIELDGAVPELADVAGVTSVEAGDAGVRVTVKGSPAPLLQVLAGAPVRQLRTHTPSLEEIFLSYY